MACCDDELNPTFHNILYAHPFSLLKYRFLLCIITEVCCNRCFRDCPNDINEAVSSLIFASARFGDLPELLVIRKLFGERYGKRFEMTALELLPGNLVNRQVVH